MSQRNPLNDRYQTDERKGQTRKSAATAKPKAKAASSVRVISTEKTPKQKRAAARAKRQQETTIEQKYYHPPTPEYRKWKKVWWVCLAGSLSMTGGSLAISFLLPELQVVSNTMIGLGYAFLIGFFFTDFAKIRKIRRKYQAEMKAQAKTTKESRAEAKRKHAAAVAAKKKLAEKTEVVETKPTGLQAFFSYDALKGLAQRFFRGEKKAPEVKDESKGK